MINKLNITIVLFLTLFLGFEAFSQSPTPIPTNNAPEYIDVTIEEVVTNPKKYNEKKVTLEGKVKEYKYTTSSKGEPFTLFKLIDNDNNEVRVYYEDKHLPFSKGDQVRISGRYRKHKKYLFFKIKNIIKARTAQIL